MGVVPPQKASFVGKRVSVQEAHRGSLKKGANDVLTQGATILMPSSADDRLRAITTNMHTCWPKYGTVQSIDRSTVVLEAQNTKIAFPLASIPETVERLCPSGCPLKLSIVPSQCTICGTSGTHTKKCKEHNYTLCQYCCGKSYLPLVGTKVLKGPTYTKHKDSEEGTVVSHPAKGHGLFEVQWDGGATEGVRGPPFQDVVTSVAVPKEAYSVEKGFRFNQVMDNVQEKSVRGLDDQPVTVITREIVNSEDCHEFRVVLNSGRGAVAVIDEDSCGITDSGVTMLSSSSGLSFMRDGKVVHQIPTEVLKDEAEVIVKISKNTAEFSWRPDRGPECFNLPLGNFRFGVQLENSESALIKDSWRPPAFKWTDIDLNVADPKTVLGEGSHGRVYRASLRDVPVAVKVLKKGIKQRELQYTREVDALAAVRDSPYNLKLVGVVPGVCGIITELCDQTLKEYVEGKGGLCVDEALRFAKEVALGMHVAEKAGLVHCDLNCSNVFVAHRAGPDGVLRPTAVVGDYGMTLPASQVKGRRGSLMYMAPELFEGKKNCTATDVFSYAVVLRFLFTGVEPTPTDYNEAPPLAAHLESVTLRGRSAQVASGVLTGIRPNVGQGTPGAVKNLIENCWAESPKRRPSFAAIAKILESIERARQ
eukprot:TRINITY_DN11203_c0_g1_i6.p1 TRINITY_DN11203_c0_g1~~TRINITY_DN11203_c0_g1_i6.p1  ORF type:complete len:675 (+),score=202.85 TRINITY_DN11203_c0_g1_i6:81-2027(+)